MGVGGGTDKGGGKHMSGQWDGQKKWEMGDEVVQCREEANKQCKCGNWDPGVIVCRVKMPGKTFLQGGTDC